MKTALLNLLAIAMAFLLNTTAYAQKQTLLPDSDELPKEVENYMGVKTTMNKELKSEVKKFCEKLEKHEIDELHRSQIVILMNMYVKRHANPNPHMLNFIKTVNEFWNHNKLDQFQPWSEYMEEILQHPQMSIAKINEIAHFTANLLANNCLELSSARTWYLSNSNFTIYIDKDKENDKTIFVKTDNTDLRCKIRDDSSLVIYGTSGIFCLSQHEWTGKKGKVDWRRANLSPDSVYATLSDYVVDTKSSEVEADNVEFFNKKYFNKAIKGKYHDRTVLNSVGVKARFPQFTSFDNDIEIPNLSEGIDYVGGYAQNGVIFKGEVPDSNEFAILTIKRNDKPFIIAQSKAIVFGLKKLEAKIAKITILLDKDGQITHNGVKLKYDSDNDSLVLFKGTSGMENANYHDTYHNLDFNINQIEWIRNDTTLRLCTRPAAPLDYALFESTEFFSESRYQAIKGLDRIHPLIMLRDCRNAYCSNELTAQQVRTYLSSVEGIHLTNTQIHQMLIQLSYDSFIDYDVQTKVLVVNQKTSDYIGAHSNHRDYDGISIISQEKNKRKNIINAIINLNNNDLTIYHVLPFNLSPKRMVKVIPDSVSSNIVVHKGLDIDINGKIQAGLADLYGNNFKFTYNDFSIHIPECDSMSMLTVNYHEKIKRNKIDSVRSVLENIKGVIKIDEDNNKSGAKETAHMPILTTTDTSYVYYDKLIDDSYDRERFFMRVNPFTLDSLNFLQLNGVQAKGTFVSGIFPDMDVTLTVQNDLSLGFVLPTPEKGMDLFQGKGVYHNTVTLNSKGLGGSGEINYLTAVARGEQFMFFPDSVTGGVNSLEIKPVTPNQIGTIPNVLDEYPDVVSDTCMIVWMPHSDKFSAISQDTTLFLYNKQFMFNGRIDLSTNGMKANGKMLYASTGLTSEKYTLKNNTFQADSAVFCDFNENTPGDSTGFFYTDRYNALYTLNNKTARFIKTNDSARVYFPHHKYKQRTEFFEWNIERNIYQFGNTLTNYDTAMIARSDADYEKIKYQNSEYKPLRAGVTMISDKDSLRFNALSSSFNNKENVINVNEPGLITVVDTRIDPTGIININQGGNINRFDNAVITANTDTLIHKIINTSVWIRDKKYFKALGGQYEYQNYKREKAYLNLDSLEIRLIKLDTAASAPKVRVSFGIGSVPAEQNFMISPQFMFVGKYSFNGQTPGIKFNGFSHIQQNCDTTTRPFKFEGTINPDSILFPISDKVMDVERHRLATGFFYNEESQSVYSLFMGVKINAADKEVLAANRGLTFEPKKNEYRVATPKRLRDTSNTGNYVVFYPSICNLYGEGEINTLADIAPVKLSTKGEIYHNRDSKKISAEMLVSIDFPIRQDVVKLMAEDINDVVRLDPIYLNKPRIRKRLEFMVGTDTVATIMDNYTTTGEIKKVPNGLSKTIVLTDVKLVYDTASTSYRSVGDIGVGFIGGTPVNKYMSGCLEIVHNKKKGDQISLYLQPTSRRWFYFNYKSGIMYCLSSDEEFNDKIINTKEKDRIVKIDKLEYQYVKGADENKNAFIRKFDISQSNITDEPSVDDLNKANEENGDDADNTGDTPSDNPLPEDNTTPSNNVDTEPSNADQSIDSDDSDFVLEDDPTPEDDSHEQKSQDVESLPQDNSVPQEEPQVEEQQPSPSTEDSNEEEQDFIDE